MIMVGNLFLFGYLLCLQSNSKCPMMDIRLSHFSVQGVVISKHLNSVVESVQALYKVPTYLPLE